MKRYFAAALLSLTMLLSGCVGEDWSLCGPDDNCKLQFSFQDENGRDVFADHIQSVDLFIFDENYSYAGYARVEKADLEVFQGITLTIEPGEYNIVCWGNLGTNITYNNTISTISETVIETVPNTEGDPLYYAPYRQITPRGAKHRAGEGDMSAHKIVIPKNEVIEKELTFIRAHRSINIYIQGYTGGDGVSSPPVEIEVTNLANAYDCLLRVSSDRADYKATTSKINTPDGQMQAVSISTPYHEIGDDITLTITNPVSGDLLCIPVNLQEYLEEQGYPSDPLELHEIEMLVKFASGSVTVTLPDWGETPVGPGLR